MKIKALNKRLITRIKSRKTFTLITIRQFLRHFRRHDIPFLDITNNRPDEK